MGTRAGSPFRLWGIATGVLAAVAVVAGLIGFSRYLGANGSGFAGARPADLLFYTLQLFVLGPSPFGAPPYGAWLSVAMFLAPLSTVMALLQTVSGVFRTWWAARALRGASGHAVVVGATPEAFALAQKLADRGLVVLVGSAVTADVGRRHHVRIVDADPVDEQALRAAGVPGAACVFALTGSGAANAGVALRVRSLHEKLAPGSGIAVHARVDDAELVAAMRARRLGAEGDRGFRVDFFSITAVAATALLDQYPPGPDAVVVGSEAFAQAVRGELRRRRRRAGEPDPAPLVPSDATDGLAPPANGTTYVCMDDPDDVLRIGLQLMLSDHPRVVLCLGRRAALADALEQKLFDRAGGELYVFGVLDAACDPDLLRRNALIERLARALHARYLREYGGSGHASAVDWNRLDDRFKDDNRAQADDIGAKLAALEVMIVPAAPALPAYALTADDVEELAEKEHLRWTRSKADAGVVHGPVRTATTHPDILPWAELDEGVKEKDRMFVRALPGLLADEDLAIVRRAVAGDGQA